MTCFDVFLGVEHNGPCSSSENCGDSMTCYEYSMFDRRCQCLQQYLPKDNGFCGRCLHSAPPVQAADAYSLSLHFLFRYYRPNVPLMSVTTHVTTTPVVPPLQSTCTSAVCHNSRCPTANVPLESVTTHVVPPLMYV